MKWAVWSLVMVVLFAALTIDAVFRDHTSAAAIFGIGVGVYASIAGQELGYAARRCRR